MGTKECKNYAPDSLLQRIRSSEKTPADSGRPTDWVLKNLLSSMNLWEVTPRSTAKPPWVPVLLTNYPPPRSGERAYNARCRRIRQNAVTAPGIQKSSRRFSSHRLDSAESVGLHESVGSYSPFHSQVSSRLPPRAFFKRPIPFTKKPAPFTQRLAPFAKRPAPFAKRPAPFAKRPAPFAKRPVPFT